MLNLLHACRGMVADEDARVDFGMAEALAFGTLALHRGVRPPGSEQAPADASAADASLGLNFGAYAVRLTGQDVERGTFNHRHAVVYDEVTGARCVQSIGMQGLHDLDAGLLCMQMNCVCVGQAGLPERDPAGHARGGGGLELAAERGSRAGL